MPRFENTATWHGFDGASSMARLSVEAALAQRTRRFEVVAPKRGAGLEHNKKQQGRV
jgi:hypothetical protein